MTTNLVAYSNTCIVCESGIWACLSWILLQSLSQDCHQGVSQGWSLLWEVRKICFEGHTAVGSIQFLAGCWTEALAQRACVNQRLPLLPCFTATWACPCGRLLDQCHLESQQSAAEVEAMISCNAVTVVTLPHLCHILLLRSQSQALPPLKGRGLHEAVDKRGRVVCISGSVSHKEACQMLHAFICVSTNSTNLS